MRKLLEQLAVTAELMQYQISPVALSALAKRLQEFPVEIVMEALERLRDEKGARFSQGAIIEQIEKLQSDGRPGADEAWAMIPRDEYASVVMTAEMAEAMKIAQPLLDEGDQVAARMAFKESYNRIVDANKRAKVAPKWFPSLGQDKEGRDSVLADAVRLGRISSEHAAGLLPAPKGVGILPALMNGTALRLESAGSKADDAETRANVMSRLAAMKNMVGSGAA